MFHGLIVCRTGNRERLSVLELLSENPLSFSAAEHFDTEWWGIQNFCMSEPRLSLVQDKER